MIGAKPLRIRFDKIDGFIKVYDGTRYLLLFGGEKYHFIYNKVRHVIGVRKVIAYVVSNNYAKLKVDSYDSLHLEKALTFQNVTRLIKLVFNKVKDNYYHNILLG